MKRVLALISLFLSPLPVACDGTTPTEEKNPPSSGGLLTDYPPGPYGVSEGWVVANLGFHGKRDDNGNGSPTDDEPRFLRLSDYHQDEQLKVLVVSLGAEWCPPCRYEQAGLIQMYKDYQAENAGVAIMLALSQDFDFQPADLETLDRWGQNPWPDGDEDGALIPFDLALDPTSSLDVYAPAHFSIPWQMVIRTSDMRIVARGAGGDFDARAAIDAVLAE